MGDATEDRYYQGWVAVFRTGTDFEADLVRDRLDSAGIPAVVLTLRDHAFNLNIGDMASVNVMVPPDRVEEAARILDEPPFDEAELSQAALTSDPAEAPAYNQDTEAILDSGIEKITLSVPDEDDMVDTEEDESEEDKTEEEPPGSID